MDTLSDTSRSRREWRWHWLCPGCQHEFFTVNGAHCGNCLRCGIVIEGEQHASTLVDVNDDDGTAVELHHKPNRPPRR